MDDGVPSSVIDEAKMLLRTSQGKQAYELLTPYQFQGLQDSVFLTLLGVSACFAGKCNEGLNPLEAAAELSPTPSAHYNVGQCHQGMGDVDQAKTCYKYAISMDPTYGPALRAMSDLRELGHGTVSDHADSTDAPPAEEHHLLNEFTEEENF